MSKIKKILSKFKDKKILVIGDVMLDRYLIGDVNRIHNSIMKVLSRGGKIPDNDIVEWYSGISFE